MELNATVLNSAEKVLMHFVTIGEGDVSIYRNLIEKSGGRQYLPRQVEQGVLSKDV